MGRPVQSVESIHRLKWLSPDKVVLLQPHPQCNKFKCNQCKCNKVKCNQCKCSKFKCSQCKGKSPPQLLKQNLNTYKLNCATVAEATARDAGATRVAALDLSSGTVWLRESRAKIRV